MTIKLATHLYAQNLWIQSIYFKFIVQMASLHKTFRCFFLHSFIAQLLKKEQNETNIKLNYRYCLSIQVTHHINKYPPIIT